MSIALLLIAHLGYNGVPASTAFQLVFWLILPDSRRLRTDPLRFPWWCLVPFVGWYQWQKRARAQQREREAATPPPGTGYFVTPTWLTHAILTGLVPSMPWPPLDLPTRQQDDTIRAWRRACLVLVDGKVRFAPVAHIGTFDADATAVCLLWFQSGTPGHAAPDQNCTCGFYAVTKERYRAELTAGYSTSVCTLDVDLFGRVIVHENGYRAERQRVLGVTLDPCAVDCDEATAAVLFAPVLGERPRLVCERHLPLFDGLRTEYPDVALLSVDEIAQHLGVEVRSEVRAARELDQREETK